MYRLRKAAVGGVSITTGCGERGLPAGVLGGPAPPVLDVRLAEPRPANSEPAVFCHIPFSACRLPFAVFRFPPAFPFCDARSPPHSTDCYVQPSSEPCLLNHQTARNVARLFLTDPCKSHGVWLTRRCTPVTPLGPVGNNPRELPGLGGRVGRCPPACTVVGDVRWPTIRPGLG